MTVHALFFCLSILYTEAYQSAIRKVQPFLAYCYLTLALYYLGFSICYTKRLIL